jgi:biopolymer transport protein ExbB/TolQ
MIWISAAGIVIPLLFGLAGTVVGMIGAMDTMGLSGGSDPDVLAKNVSLALITTAGGLVISLIALPIFVTAIVLFFKSRRRLETLTLTEQIAAGQPATRSESE